MQISTNSTEQELLPQIYVGDVFYCNSNSAFSFQKAIGPLKWLYGIEKLSSGFTYVSNSKVIYAYSSCKCFLMLIALPLCFIGMKYYGIGTSTEFSVFVIKLGLILLTFTVVFYRRLAVAQTKSVKICSTSVVSFTDEVLM